MVAGNSLVPPDAPFLAVCFVPTIVCNTIISNSLLLSTLKIVHSLISYLGMCRECPVPVHTQVCLFSILLSAGGVIFQLAWIQCL